MQEIKGIIVLTQDTRSPCQQGHPLSARRTSGETYCSTAVCAESSRIEERGREDSGNLDTQILFRYTLASAGEVRPGDGQRRNREELGHDYLPNAFPYLVFRRRNGLSGLVSSAWRGRAGGNYRQVLLSYLSLLAAFL